MQRQTLAGKSFLTMWGTVFGMVTYAVGSSPSLCRATRTRFVPHLADSELFTSPTPPTQDKYLLSWEREHRAISEQWRTRARTGTSFFHRRHPVPFAAADRTLCRTCWHWHCAERDVHEGVEARE